VKSFIYCDSNVLSVLATGRGLEERPEEERAINELRVKLLTNEVVLINSYVLRAELGAYGDPRNRALRRELLKRARKVVIRTRTIDRRSTQLRTIAALSLRDAQHIACAEAAGAKALLTYDKHMLDAARFAKVAVIRPSEYLRQEIEKV